MTNARETKKGISWLLVFRLITTLSGRRGVGGMGGLGAGEGAWEGWGIRGRSRLGGIVLLKCAWIFQEEDCRSKVCVLHKHCVDCLLLL